MFATRPIKLYSLAERNMMRNIFTALMPFACIAMVSCADYKPVTFNNDLGRGKHGHSHMPEFDELGEITLPLRKYSPPIDLLTDNVKKESLRTLQQIAIHKTNEDRDAELKYSTRELREYNQANPAGLTHENERWQHYDKVELVASVVIEDYELFFLNCHAYGSEQYEAILMREDSGMMLRSFPASREMGITLAYVQSAFVTGAWSIN
jgi:hypothetical protein